MSNTQQDLLKKRILEGVDPSLNIGGIIGGKKDIKPISPSGAQSTPTVSTITPTVSTPTPQFAYENQTQLDDALKTAMSDWKGYNINADPFYQQMVDRYTKNAQLGMEDAMGRAAALTGGYGSSFAQAVGQQAYYNQMDGLNDLALDIYNNAYQRWRDKKNDAWNNYEYYATDKAAKEKQWMIDNGLWKGDDPKLDIIALASGGLGTALATLSEDERLKVLQDMGMTDDEILEFFTIFNPTH